MKVTALGTGDAFSAERYSSCLLIETSTTKVLVDCPHPIRKILRESTGGRVDIGDIDAVILTHLHADHASGLEPYAWFQRFVLQRPTTLYAHPTVLAAVWPQLHSSMEELLVVDADNHPHHREHLSFDDLFVPKPLSTTAPVQIGDLSVESRITIHHIPTTALHVSSPTSTFGYSADTAFDPELLTWLDRAKVVVHETNFGAHTPYDKLASLPERWRSKLALIHWPDGFDVDGSVFRVLRDGDVVCG
jgi:ribonuclease BN (tRNA processing enzyme)